MSKLVFHFKNLTIVTYVIDTDTCTVTVTHMRAQRAHTIHAHTCAFYLANPGNKFITLKGEIHRAK